jgi:hypothetical protein
VEIDVESFAQPKLGSTPNEYEDASQPSPGCHVQVIVGSYACAVADGATESSFARVWAELLVDAYTASPSPPDLDLLAAVKREEWCRHVQSLSLPWYAQEKAAEGAFAALVGVHLSECDDHSGAVAFSGQAIGDCCVFHVRGENLLASYPISNTTEFSSKPFLLSTEPGFIAGHALCTFSGILHSNDLLLLSSDALSCWILGQLERGSSPFPVIRDLGVPGHLSFKELVAGQRMSGSMRNDDVTLLRLNCL